MDIGGEDLLNHLLDQNDEEQPANLNISDVIEAIQIADPGFDAGAGAGGTMPPPSGRAEAARGPYVRIVEQPASKALRFRYECEGRSAGSIPGVNSTSERRTYPTIEICNYKGKAIVVVSCVTHDEPYRPHPHNLVGREHCRSGVCTVRTDVQEGTQVTFNNLGIQCVKKRDIAEHLRKREQLRVDPFRTGFAHVNQAQSIDLNAVRLCFQAFLDDGSGKFRNALPPVVSDVIYDKKAMSDLFILRTSHVSGPVEGNIEVFLLCEKLRNRDDIEVIVYEERDDGRHIEMRGAIGIIHKQVAIAFTLPPYPDQEASAPVDAFIQLRQPSDNARSNAVPFQYLPSFQADLKRKRLKTSVAPAVLEQMIQQSGLWKKEQDIKTEPAGESPRFTPLETAGENALQQWARDMGAGPSNAGFYAQDPWHGQTFAAPVQAMQVAGLSPNVQMSNMQGQGMSPQRRVISPHRRDVSPQGQVMSPHGQVMSPHGQVMSPHGQVMSPHGQVMSPQHQMMSPQHQAMSPQQMMPQQGHVMSPQHQMMSPQPVMSPQHQMMSPQHQMMSPQHQAMSPQGQMMSPQGQMMSPQRQMLAPQMGQVPGDSGAGQMGHASPNMDAMAQQGMAQAQAQQPMDSSSSISLSGLLAMPADSMPPALNFNSGELSDLLGTVNRPDLSDGLYRLSTSDVLGYAADQ